MKMQWKRLVLVALVVLLQGLAEARSRRNTTRTRQNRRTQDRFRPVESSRLSENQGDVQPLAPPHHSSLRQQHAYRGQHSGRVRHLQGRHHAHGHHHSPHHAHHPQQLGAADHHECPNCYQLEMRKKLRLAQIKDRVLTATGLIKPPNMTGVVLSNNPDVQGIIQTMEVPTAYLHEPIYNEDEPDVKTEMLFFPVQPGNGYTPSPGNSSPLVTPVH